MRENHKNVFNIERKSALYTDLIYSKICFISLVDTKKYLC